jgi:hypothetical protein
MFRDQDNITEQRYQPPEARTTFGGYGAKVPSKIRSRHARSYTLITGGSRHNRLRGDARPRTFARSRTFEYPRTFMQPEAEGPAVLGISDALNWTLPLCLGVHKNSFLFHIQVPGRSTRLWLMQQPRSRGFRS